MASVGCSFTWPEAVSRGSSETAANLHIFFLLFLTDAWNYDLWSWGKDGGTFRNLLLCSALCWYLQHSRRFFQHQLGSEPWSLAARTSDLCAWPKMLVIEGRRSDPFEFCLEAGHLGSILCQLSLFRAHVPTSQKGQVFSQYENKKFTYNEEQAIFLF